MSFKSLGLTPHVLQGVAAAGYSEPTPIQLRAIPAVLTGRDLIGSAQTGTGKTAAFALPVLSRLERHSAAGARVLVLEPTRELAAQVETSFRDLGRFTDLQALVVHGGVGYGRQRDALRAGMDIVVATPGRLLDFLKEGLRLDRLEVLILDEVDRMLDMGFLPDVRRIIQACPKQRQTLFFSATVPPEIAEIAAFALRDPQRIEVGINRTVNKSVTHAMYPVAKVQKHELLEALLHRTEYDSVLVFSRTKHGADRIARRLKAGGHAVAVLHANRSQNQRVEALAGFKSGKYEVMVATDIAARGIDVAGVSHVMNYDIPANPEDYVHRIGRTGRAQAVGDAFTLITPEDAGDVRAIERFIGQKIPQLKLDDFAYLPLDTASPAPPRDGQRQGTPGGGQGHGRGGRGRQQEQRGRRDGGQQRGGPKRGDSRPQGSAPDSRQDRNPGSSPARGGPQQASGQPPQSERRGLFSRLTRGRR